MSAVKAIGEGVQGVQETIKVMQSMIGLESERKMLTSAIKSRIPALLIGETGTGKTSLCKEVARGMGRKVMRVNLDGGVTPDEIIGRYQARSENGASVTYFQEGIVPRAMREGAVLILDEINAALPDTLFCLHALLESEPRLFIPETQEELVPCEGFSVVATMNPSHEYAGTKGLNPALYSRFGVVLRFQRLQGARLLEALKQHVPAVSADAAIRICAVVEETAKLRDAEKVNTRLTLRECISAALLACDGLKLDEAIQAALLQKLEPYELAQITSFRPGKVALKEELTIDALMQRAGEWVGLQEQVSKLHERIAALQELERVLGAVSQAMNKAKK